MKHLIIAGTAAAVLLAAVSCGGSGRSRRSDGSDGPASYLTVGNSKIAFIQWRATSNGHLDGMITEGKVGGGAPAGTLFGSNGPVIGATNGGLGPGAILGFVFFPTPAPGPARGRQLSPWGPPARG